MTTITPGKLYYLKVIPAEWKMGKNLNLNISPGVYMLTSIDIMPNGGAKRTGENTLYLLGFLIGLKESYFYMSQASIDTFIKEPD